MAPHPSALAAHWLELAEMHEGKVRELELMVEVLRAEIAVLKANAGWLSASLEAHPYSRANPEP
jgi:hypothetical protein